MARVSGDEDGIAVDLERAELDLLVRLCEGLATRLRAGGDDPVIERLAPPASRGDAEADAELRRLLRSDLLDGRAERLARLAAELRAWGAADGRAGVHAVLDAEAALGLLQGLNDLRLALGASIDIEALDRDGLGPDDRRTLTLALMDRLAGLQEGLVGLLDG